MSSMAEEIILKVKELEDDRNLWKQRYFSMVEQNEWYKSKVTEMMEENPAKRPRLDIENSSRDPLKLPEPAIMGILKHLTGKELLNICEVSKHWRSYIESNKVLMDRAMDGVVVRFNREKSMKHDLMRENSYLLRRNYKHMVVYLPQTFKTLIRLFEHYAKYLETLIVDVKCVCIKNYEDSSIFPINFVNLKKLRLGYIYEDYFGVAEDMEDVYTFFEKMCSFPEVTDLFVVSNSAERDYLKKILPKFPKLKCFFTNVENDNHLFDASQKNLPKLKFLGVYEIDGIGGRGSFWLTFKSLVEIFVFLSICILELHKILMALPNLKRLIFQMYQEDMEINEINQLPLHGNLEILDVGIDINIDNNVLHQLLLKFPMLKELVLRDWKVTEDNINFLATNMRTLKKLGYSKIKKKALKAYESLRNNENRFINPTFELYRCEAAYTGCFTDCFDQLSI